MHSKGCRNPKVSPYVLRDKGLAAGDFGVIRFTLQSFMIAGDSTYEAAAKTGLDFTFIDRLIYRPFHMS